MAHKVSFFHRLATGSSALCKYRLKDIQQSFKTDKYYLRKGSGLGVHYVPGAHPWPDMDVSQWKVCLRQEGAEWSLKSICSFIFHCIIVLKFNFDLKPSLDGAYNKRRNCVKQLNVVQRGIFAHRELICQSPFEKIKKADLKRVG